MNTGFDYMANFVSKLRAGGPGSGPHPGEGKKEVPRGHVRITHEGVTGETDHAVKIKVATDNGTDKGGKAEIWISKSQIKEDDRENNKITVPKWVADSKEQNHDNQGSYGGGGNTLKLDKEQNPEDKKEDEDRSKKAGEKYQKMNKGKGPKKVNWD